MRIIDFIIDCLFPRRCPVCHDIVDEMGELICEKCKGKLIYVKEPYCMKCGKPLSTSEKEYCIQCEGNERNFIEGRSVFIYDDVMRKSIYSFKYNGRQEYAKFYAKEIVRQLLPKIKEWKAEAIIPIPLHKSKLIKRGYNQADLIAKELSNLTNIPVYSNYLLRTRKTENQKNLTASERGKNLKNAFKIGQNNVKFKTTILIDDIYTTGATIMSATEVLSEYGVEKVYFITLSTGR